MDYHRYRFSQQFAEFSVPFIQFGGIFAYHAVAAPTLYGLDLGVIVHPDNDYKSSVLLCLADKLMYALYLRTRCVRYVGAALLELSVHCLRHTVRAYHDPSSGRKLVG